MLSLLLFLATAVTRYTAATCYNTFLASLIQQLGIVCLVNRSFLAPLLSYHFATDTLLADTNLSGVVELTTQLLILENILSLPLESNQ